MVPRRFLDTMAAMTGTPAIAFENVTFAYGDGFRALNGLTFAVDAGEMVALTGDNGCGKSTAARLIDALLIPDGGAVRIFGMDTAKAANMAAIRQACALVFQNPDDQMVATLVRDEVAFGPRNLGLSAAEVAERVDEALAAVGMQEHAGADVNALSGGQKQRIAIAGALAMRPRILILDEATSMLDEAATRHVVETLGRLRGDGMTIVLITHDPALAACADRMIPLSGPSSDGGPLRSTFSVRTPAPDAALAIQLESVTFAYGEQERPVLDDLSLAIPEGAFCVVTGPNGSGKSTLLMHLNGLLRPTSGRVLLFGQELAARHDVNQARFTTGLVFQYPERQLFESTVFDDVAFGPRNLGVSPEEAATRVEEALCALGLAEQGFAGRNPFTLSGGQQRKAAIAGILAMRPRILVLDEPCAGLDAASREELFCLLARLNQEGTTIIMVSHDDAASRFPGCQVIQLG